MMRIFPWRWLRAELGPLIALVLVLAGALAAVSQYGQLRLERQRAETARYLAEFDHGPVAAAWRCLSEVWRAEWPRHQELLAPIAAEPGDPPPAALQAYRRMVLDTVDGHCLEEAVTIVFQYYRRLALCIRMGGCDRATAVDHLGEPAWRFREQHYPFLTEHLAPQQVDQVFESLKPPYPRGGALQAASPRGGDGLAGRQSADGS
jgi:hypothetical protein